MRGNKVGCDGREPASLVLTRRFATGLVSFLIVLASLIVVLAGFGVHTWNMHGAALECPSQYGAVGQISRGGWAEPDWCRYPVGESHPALRGPYHFFDPWPSAVGFIAMTLATLIGAVFIWRRVHGLTWVVSAATFIVVAVAVVTAGWGLRILNASG